MDWDDYFRQPAVIVFTQPRPTGDIAASQQAKHRCHSLARRAQKKRLGDRIWFQPVVVRGLHGVGRRGLPAWPPILDVIGDLLAYRCQVDELLLDEGIFGLLGKLPIQQMCGKPMEGSSLWLRISLRGF
jgi:hypothetical protein